MSLTEDEVINSMKTSLAEWGIRTRLGEEHVAFHDKAIESALKATFFDFDNDSTNNKDLTELPATLRQALRHVISNEMSHERTKLYVDKLDSSDLGGIHGPPFYFDKYKNSYMKRKKFDVFKQSELDPMRRFSRYDLPPSLRMFDTLNDQGIIDGLQFETIVSHHAVHSKIPCENCHMTGTLQWNGGSDSSSAWKDLVCTNCGSTYEIKSKKNLACINKTFEYNRIYGGSYFLFNKLMSQSSRKMKHYIVQVGREHIWSDEGKGYYQVELAEMYKALPMLSDTSFLNRDRKMLSLKSNVILKRDTRKTWFKVPAKKCDWATISRSVFETQYPDVNWNNAKEEIEKILESTEPASPTWCAESRSWYYEGDESNANSQSLEISDALNKLVIDPQKEVEEKSSSIDKEESRRLKDDLNAFASITENWDGDEDGSSIDKEESGLKDDLHAFASITENWDEDE